MILVDSSVWIGYFRSGENAEKLEKLIEMDLVCTNEIVLSELCPILKIQGHKDLIDSLLALPCIPYSIFWEGIRALQTLNLQNGINKVGLPDLMICQHCLEAHLDLFSLDKHFKLMAAHTSLKMFN